MFLALKMSDKLTPEFWENSNYYITVAPDERCHNEFFFFEGKYFGMLHITSSGDYVLMSEERSTVVPYNLRLWYKMLIKNNRRIPVYGLDFNFISLTP